MQAKPFHLTDPYVDCEQIKQCRRDEIRMRRLLVHQIEWCLPTNAMCHGSSKNTKNMQNTG